MINSRVIPVLSLDSTGRAVKTVRFKNRTYIGDPVNAVRIFNDKEVDEICILDIDASRKGYAPNFRLIESIASQAFMPLAYGGGVTTLQDIRRLFKIGIEKVVLNTSLHTSSSLIYESSHVFGSQSIVASVDVRRGLFGRYAIYSHGGSKRQSIHLDEHIKTIQHQGVGEIVIHSIDRDGMMNGYDTELITHLSTITSVPIVALGGAGSKVHLMCALEAGASAVAAGSIFVYQGTHKAVLLNYNRNLVT